MKNDNYFKQNLDSEVFPKSSQNRLV